MSLDEAYLDVTDNTRNIPLAHDIALVIRSKIKAETELNASAGISYSKSLAKLASDHRKPNGQYVIPPEMRAAFVETMPIGRFHGIGPATAAKMHALVFRRDSTSAIRRCRFWKRISANPAPTIIGSRAASMSAPSGPTVFGNPSGAENTFANDLMDFDAMVAELQPLIDMVWRHCESTGNRGRTVTLKVKFTDFEIISRSRSMPEPTEDRSDLERAASDLLRQQMLLPKAVRLLGVSLAISRNIPDGMSQLSMPI